MAKTLKMFRLITFNIQTHQKHNKDKKLTKVCFTQNDKEQKNISCHVTLKASC